MGKKCRSDLFSASFLLAASIPMIDSPQQEATYPFDAFPPYARGLVRALSMDVVHGLATLSREGATETGESNVWRIFCGAILSNLSKSRIMLYHVYIVYIYIYVYI